MQNGDALLAKNAGQVKFLDRERPPNLARAIIPDARPAKAKPAVRNVELVAVPPRPALRHADALVPDIS